MPTPTLVATEGPAPQPELAADSQPSAVCIVASSGLLSPILQRALGERGIVVRTLGLGAALCADGSGAEPGGSTIALVAGAQFPTTRAAAQRLLQEIGASCSGLIVAGDVAEEVTEIVGAAAGCWLTLPVQELPLVTALHRIAESAATRGELQETRRRLAAKAVETQSLYEVGAALSAEHDARRLQDLILRRCRHLTAADAGSLYILEHRVNPETHEKYDTLHFVVSQNDSLTNDYHTFEIPVSSESIAGYVALTGCTLNLPDVYCLPSHAPYRFNRSMDEATGYRTTSMLVVPLRNHDEDIIGVIQLINCKAAPESRPRVAGRAVPKVRPFPLEAEQVAGAFAGQAATALNNRMLIDNIQRLFEGFVTASVKAIEARDPATSGHSERVAHLTVGIASAVNGLTQGRWGNVTLCDNELRELRYAALLHDFGKIGVREQVLLKARRLYPEQVEAINARFDAARRSLQVEQCRRELALVLEGGREQYLAERMRIQAEFRQKGDLLSEQLAAILEANGRDVQDARFVENLGALRSSRYVDTWGVERPLLEASELLALSVQRGSLTDDERRHIESHVQQTYDFLSLIPWTRQLHRLPLIAGAHHERMDGSGYPRGIAAEEIPLQSRMMAIADVFDALTAQDRPYRPAVSPGQALDILGAEAYQGKLDGDLLDVFITHRVYEQAPSDSPGC